MGAYDCDCINNLEYDRRERKAQLSQEGTTSDLISRTETVKQLQGVFDVTVPITDYDGGFIDGVEVGVSTVSTMPPAQPEPKWIPVESKMPEDMQFVLLTVRRLKNGYNHEPFISVGYIGWNHQHWWCAHDGDCEISKVEVLAWMPLPEAYKPNK